MTARETENSFSPFFSSVSSKARVVVITLEVIGSKKMTRYWTLSTGSWTDPGPDGSVVTVKKRSTHFVADTVPGALGGIVLVLPCRTGEEKWDVAQGHVANERRRI